VFIDDPDVPGRRIPALEQALRVQGPGPIDIKKGQAVLVDVEFDCPSDPARRVFKSSVAPLSIAISATVNLGSVSGITLTSPADIAPGETRNFAFQLFSDMGHAVSVGLEYDPGFDDQFSAATTAFVTVPPGGGTASVTVPVTCTARATEGLHHLGFTIRD